MVSYQLASNLYLLWKGSLKRIVSFRPGPTETIEIGIPANFSMASR